MVCRDCSNYIDSLNAFKMKVTSLQTMFVELEQLESPEQVISTRLKFGLAGDIEIQPIDELYDVLEESDRNKDFQAEEYIEEHLNEDPPSPDPPPHPKRRPQRKNLHKTENEKLYEFKCHKCAEEFPKMQMLSSHCRSEHQTIPQVLCWCGTVLSTWKRLMAHKSKHINEADEFTCGLCRISYKKKSAFDKHNATRHGPDAERFICSQCGKEFKERQILKNHEKTHLPDELKLKHPCSYCVKKFVNSHCLKIHIARVHEKVALHTCELCGKGCITKSDLKWHMDKHVEERNFECEICQLKFKSTNSLRIHKRRHFNQDKAVVCPTCGKEFFSSAALSNHKLVHSTVKRYKCFCGNEYKRLESYKCHLNSTHTGEVSSERFFVGDKDLELNLIFQRPFSCSWCTRTFVNSANCRKHKLKDHPVEVAAYEAVHGKKGVSLAVKAQQSDSGFVN